MREVVMLCENTRHLTTVLTTRQDLSLPQVLYRMFNRWRQENSSNICGKYMREEFAIDSLVEYGLLPVSEGLTRLNPEKKRAKKGVKRAQGELLALKKTATELELMALRTPPTTEYQKEKSAQKRLDADERVTKKEQELATLQSRYTALPERIPALGMERLPMERKLITDTVKMCAYRIETKLVRQMGAAYARTEEDGRTLIAAAMNSPADLTLVGGELRVTLGRQSSAHRDRALSTLCASLNQMNVQYPGTSLRLIYAVQDASP